MDDRELADEIARLEETLFMRLEARPARVGRVMSRSALRREGGLHHAEWELAFGVHREHGEALRKKAERSLRLPAEERQARTGPHLPPPRSAS